MKPPYVEYGARVTAPPPFSCHEGHFQALVLKGKSTSIVDLCERVLNQPAAGSAHYTPVGEHVLLLTGSFARIASQAPGFGARGSIKETQLSLWVPALANNPNTSPPQSDSLCMFVPYIFVDNPMSYLGGREDYGYPKALGQFEPHSGLGATISLNAYGGDFAASNQAEWRQLLKIEGPKATAAAVAGGAWKTGPELAALLGEAAGPTAAVQSPAILGLIWSLIEDLLEERGQQIFLKQIRDAGAADVACYQALVEAPVEVSNVQWRPSFSEWKLTVKHLDSHPIAADLGVESQTTRLTYEIKFDMNVGTGTIVAPKAMI